MSRRICLGRYLLVVASVIGLTLVGWLDADAAGRGGGRGGGGMSRSSPARSGGMSSPSASQRSPQPSSRQAAPTQRPAAQPSASQPSRSPSTSQGAARTPDAAATRQGSAQENQAQRQGRSEEGREDRQDYRDESREDRQDYYDDWDNHGYYGYDNDWAEVMVVGVTVGAVVAAADYDDHVETTTITNVTTTTNVTALASLPCEASVTVANGINFYQCGSNWYTPAYQGDYVVYVPSGPPPSK